MKRGGEAFVGIDAAKTRNTVAVAEVGRRGEIRYLGEFDSAPDAVARMVRKLADRYETLHFCYEAGPTGYGLYRQILALGQGCTVVAPSMIPRKPGERVKTNRRDAQSLARLHRAGELSAVRVPDDTHEAVRDLVRRRAAAVEDYRRKRQQVGSFLLRHGRIFERRATWKGQHLRWLHSQNFVHPAQRLAYQEMLTAARAAAERIDDALQPGDPPGEHHPFATLGAEQLATEVTPGYVRLSVGLEHIDDIIADLTQALDAAKR